MKTSNGLAVREGVFTSKDGERLHGFLVDANLLGMTETQKEALIEFIVEHYGQDRDQRDA